MPKYKGTVCRTSYGFLTIEVEAKNKREAREKILEEAGDYEFSEKSSDYSLDGGVQREPNLPKQVLKFDYKGKKFNFKFTPEEEDWWTAFEQHGFQFDVHYLEDEDNDICVYLVVNGKGQYNKTIHTQKIVK